MLGVVLTLAGLALVSPSLATPMPRLSDANPMSAPPIFDISQYLTPKRPQENRVKRNLNMARATHHVHYKNRQAMRKPLQWGTCDENMTLSGSQCVCAASFYDVSNLPTITLNGIASHCSGMDSNGPNLGLMCNGDYNHCPISGGLIAGNGPSMHHWCLFYGGENDCFPDYIGLQGNPSTADYSVQIDLQTERVIGGFSFSHWFNIEFPATMGTYLELWIGNNSTGHNAAGNEKCFWFADPSTEMATLRSNYGPSARVGTWELKTGACFGRYVYIWNRGNFGSYNSLIPMSQFKLFAPAACISGSCMSCPDGKTSNPNAVSIDDCFVNHGIDVNASIGSVDYNYSSDDFLLPAGYSLLNYTDDLDVFLDNCPAGYYCLSDTTVPTPCPAGTYRDALGGTAASDCSACPAGAYCPIGSAEPVSCPAGRYRGTTGAQQPTDCALCLTGNFCPQGSVAPQTCLVGTYRDTTGATQAADCPACPAGKFCGAGTSTPSLCAAGTYNDQVGGVTQSDCYACTTGHYCEAGTVTPTDCPAGTYRAATGATAAGNCLACPAGSFCPVATTTPEACAAGTFYATTGADEQADCSDCPTGNYCPAGSVNPTACVPGTFRNDTAGTTADVCLPCTEGFYCPSASTIPTECPGGTYRNILGATASGDCFACPSGQYCGVATVTPASCVAGTYRATSGAALATDCLECPAAQYCPLATTTPVDCPGGTYRGDTGGVDRSSCTTCPTGRYCPQESSAPTLCPAGTYRAATGASAEEDCLPCPHGQYCPEGTTTPTSCPAGTYLNGTGGAGSGDCVVCPVGQYCLVRSTVPTDCDAGSYRGTTGAQSQGQCAVCPAGSYCPQKSVAPTACDAGTYRGASGALSADDCLVCPAGRHCASGTVTPTLCNAGSYRPSTSGQTQADCTVCPAGAYCVAGSASPVFCGPGRHRDTTGAVQLSNCLLCMPGTYSLDVGRTTNCPVCTANYYCRTSTLKEACPMHTTSATGSYSRLNCKCNPGYSCTYYKRIQAIVTLNATVYDFNNDVGGVKTAFLSAMAAAANVSSSHITINGVVARTSPTAAPGSRRLLSIASRMHQSATEPSIQEEFAQMPRFHEDQKGLRKMSLAHHGDPYAHDSGSIRVFATVANAGRLNHLDHKLEAHRPGLFISHRWERHSSVTAEKEP